MINPSKFYNLLIKYEVIFRTSPPMLNLVPLKGGIMKVQLNIDLKPHPQFGNTKARIREWYDSNGHLIQYRYCWEEKSNPSGNICSFENEHNHGVATDPHHTHPVINDRKPCDNNYNVRSVDDFLNFVSQYILVGKNYVSPILNPTLISTLKNPPK
ncbi:hypothetical protein AN960_05405 [Bacillus sp. FJAT-25509]|uniref:toxin-antitoxin system TumE family protein n=1 Tax=Bacillus sp. FJAT-25509 TaxID=1712029 RepID=UPI0006FFA6C2|nr:DUF6516 family protein [Bacillus sp. FJAT-25509]KQL41019.1 hypothetical protein AN960_05405 [Bacillus sp. FJAT-25509]